MNLDLIAIFIFVFGACVGSFLNVCIVRMPHEKSVVQPPSHCPNCKNPIRWHNNIPLISYLILKGKCPDCGQSFSARYFWIELLTACVFVGFYYYFGLTLLLVPYLFMASCFIVALMIDFAHRIIPDEISIGGMFFGLFFSILIPQMHLLQFSQLQLGRFLMWGCVALYFIALFISMIFSKNEEKMEKEDYLIPIFIAVLASIDGGIHYAMSQKLIADVNIAQHLLSLDASILGLLVGGGVIYMTGILGEWILKKEAMGGGDVKLLAMIGAFLGWQYVILTFFVAPVFGAVFGIVELIRTKDNTIAYGPFLVLGALICLFFGDWIIAFILNGYQVP